MGSGMGDAMGPHGGAGLSLHGVCVCVIGSSDAAIREVWHATGKAKAAAMPDPFGPYGGHPERCSAREQGPWPVVPRGFPKSHLTLCGPEQSEVPPKAP